MDVEYAFNEVVDNNFVASVVPYIRLCSDLFVLIHLNIRAVWVFRIRSQMATTGTAECSILIPCFVQ